MPTCSLRMKVIEKAEIFGAGENGTFDRTEVVCEHKDGFFIAHMSCRVGEVPYEPEMTSELDGFVVCREDIYPCFDDKTPLLSVSPDQISDLYLKQQTLLAYDHGNDHVKTLLLQEAKVLEELRNFPHPNVAKYFGVLVRDSMIVGMCFEKYSETLDERANRIGSGMRIGDCIAGIRKGIEHLHSNGYCHSNISPLNIMFRHDESTPIIIDFDSCLRIDQEITIKRGTPDFCNEKMTHSKPGNDFLTVNSPIATSLSLSSHFCGVQYTKGKPLCLER